MGILYQGIHQLSLTFDSNNFSLFFRTISYLFRTLYPHQHVNILIMYIPPKVDDYLTELLLYIPAMSHSLQVISVAAGSG